MREIGDFTVKVSFMTMSNSKTEGGAPQKSFTHSFYAWCSKKQVGTGMEQYMNDRLATPYRYIFRTHYRDDINETMRISDGSAVYNILSVDPDGLFINILTEKIV